MWLFVALAPFGFHWTASATSHCDSTESGSFWSKKQTNKQTKKHNPSDLQLTFLEGLMQLLAEEAEQLVAEVRSSPGRSETFTCQQARSSVSCKVPSRSLKRKCFICTSVTFQHSSCQRDKKASFSFHIEQLITKNAFSPAQQRPQLSVHASIRWSSSFLLHFERHSCFPEDEPDWCSAGFPRAALDHFISPDFHVGTVIRSESQICWIFWFYLQNSRHYSYSCQHFNMLNWTWYKHNSLILAC